MPLFPSPPFILSPSFLPALFFIYISAFFPSVVSCFHRFSHITAFHNNPLWIFIYIFHVLFSIAAPLPTFSFSPLHIFSDILFLYFHRACFLISIFRCFSIHYFLFSFIHRPFLFFFLLFLSGDFYNNFIVSLIVAIFMINFQKKLFSWFCAFLCFHYFFILPRTARMRCETITIPAFLLHITFRLYATVWRPE